MTNDYLTRTKPFSALLVFSIPMIIGSLFQQLYTMVDSAIVGRYVSEQALASIGASFSLTTVFICVAIGGGMGASVIVSRYFGAKDYTGMKRAVSTVFITFLIISIALGGIGIIINRPILLLLRTPDDALGMALVYLKIYFLGLPFLFMYNVISSMFNAIGKSRIPLMFLIFSSVLNVLLDILFVTRLHLGVEGAAWATLIAQGISAACSFLVFLKLMQAFPNGRFAYFDFTELKSMARIALPSILQQSAVSIGMMLVQSVVNSFGSESLAGYSAFTRIASIAIVPMTAINNSVSSYTAQNIGAQKLERVPQGYRAANMMVVFFSVLLCITIELFYRPLISMFLGENGSDAALRTGQSALRFEAFFYCWIGFKMAADGVLRGAGDMKLFTIANFVNLSIRVILSITLAPRFGIQWIWYSVPIGWFTNFAISYTAYRTGKWKTRGM